MLDMGSASSTPRGEINVTPLVDVTLVLLIIFMAATPLLRAGYDVALPRPKGESAPQPTRVFVRRAGALLLDGRPIEHGAFKSAISIRLAGRNNRLVVVDAEEGANYGVLVDVIDVIRQAGGRVAVALQAGGSGAEGSR